MVAKLRGPGMIRAALGTALGVAVSYVISFLIGLGAFDYWFHYASGRPTHPEDHSNHGAYSWRDYFKVNTDHKVIGIQYLVTTFVFFLIGGMLAEAFRAQLASPDNAYFTQDTYNGLISTH